MKGVTTAPFSFSLTIFSLAIVALFSLESEKAFAQEAIPCGPPGAYVMVGETSDQLLSDCGEPSNVQQYDQPNPNKGEKVVWYYVANALLDTNQEPMDQMSQGARYSVEFIDGKVNLIYSNYSYSGPYESYAFCGPVPPNARQEVKRGDTMEEVRNRCGDPSFTDVKDAGTPQPPPRVIKYTYTFDPTVPSTIVTVANGVVSSISYE
jgi:hypothetical protein